MRRKVTALPRNEEENGEGDCTIGFASTEDGETMEQLTERRNTVKQMEQVSM
jgi:hypothetical protein